MAHYTCRIMKRRSGRMTSQPNVVAVGDQAPDAVVRDEEGQEARLSSLWQDGPVAFLFVRHFG